MLFKRDDEIWETKCDRCGLKLTEVVVGDMPRDAHQARVMAMMAGWDFKLSEDVCWGCNNVQK